MVADTENTPTQNNEESSSVDATRKFNPMVVGISAAIIISSIVAIYSAVYFIDQEKQRDMQSWQIRLGIVADSRVTAVNEWAERNMEHIRELAENASLQLYMTEITMEASEEGDGEKDEDTLMLEQEEAAASAEYLQTLLTATSERTGFVPKVQSAEIAANVERIGTSGIGIVDKDARPLASTDDMPPLSPKIIAAIAQALQGEAVFIDIFTGPSGEPSIGFVIPVYGIQSSEDSGAIGAVIGIKTVDEDLWATLKQPGDTLLTAETYLVRKTGVTVEYISVLADGTPPLKRKLSMDTLDLTAAVMIERPGSFVNKRDYSGVDVLATSRSVEGLPWVLIRKISQKEALSATNTRLTTILIVFVLLIVSVVGAIIAVWRHGSSMRATQAAANMEVALERFKNMSKFMKQITDNQGSIIAAVDGNTQYTFANKLAEDEAKITADEMFGKTMAATIGPIKANVFTEINERVLKTKEAESHVLSFGDENDWDPESPDRLHVIKADHLHLNADRDFPAGVLMIQTDISELTIQRMRSEQMLRQLINTLVSVVDRRDPFSANHSNRVAEVALCIAQEMGLSEEEVNAVDIAGSLMSLGKIFISPEVLTKTEDLSAEERELMANAYLTTVDLLKGVSFSGEVVETIRQMGETWDGKGKLGMKEDEILPTARVLAVANSFVGMISPRAYRGAMPFQKSADFLMEDTGTRFDRKPVSALVNFLENRGGMDRWAHFRETPEENNES